MDSVGAPRCCEEQCVEFGSVRPGRLPHRAMKLASADSVRCWAEVSAEDVEQFGASLSSEQRALVTTFTTGYVKFTAWPELVRLFPNLHNVYARQCRLFEFPLALRCPTSACSVSGATLSWRSHLRCRGCNSLQSSISMGAHGSSDCLRQSARSLRCPLWILLGATSCQRSSARTLVVLIMFKPCLSR